MYDAPARQATAARAPAQDPAGYQPAYQPRQQLQAQPQPQQRSNGSPPGMQSKPLENGYAGRPEGESGYQNG